MIGVSSKSNLQQAPEYPWPLPIQKENGLKQMEEQGFNGMEG